MTTENGSFSKVKERGKTEDTTGGLGTLKKKKKKKGADNSKCNYFACIDNGYT